MTDHKFTDEEIIKALEICAKSKCWGDCKDMVCPAAKKQGCYFYLRTDEDYEGVIQDEMIKDALALINRQKAEIERLQAIHADMTESLRLAAEANKDMSVELDAMRGAANSYKMHYEEAERKYKIAVAEREANVEGFIETLKTIKSEAIKDFAERLKSDLGRIPQYQFTRSQVEWSINTLVKEMTEGKE